MDDFACLEDRVGYDFMVGSNNGRVMNSNRMAAWFGGLFFLSSSSEFEVEISWQRVLIFLGGGCAARP